MDLLVLDWLRMYSLSDSASAVCGWCVTTVRLLTCTDTPRPRHDTRPSAMNNTLSRGRHSSALHTLEAWKLDLILAKVYVFLFTDLLPGLHDTCCIV